MAQNAYAMPLHGNTKKRESNAYDKKNYKKKQTQCVTDSLSLR